VKALYIFLWHLSYLFDIFKDIMKYNMIYCKLIIVLK